MVFSIAVIHTMINTAWGGKSLNKLTLPGTDPPLVEVNAGVTEGRNLETPTEAGPWEFCLLAYSLWLT